MQELFVILAGVAIAAKIAINTVEQLQKSVHDLDHRER